MYNQKFFEKEFELIEKQAEDYAKAYNRIRKLLKETDPLKKRNGYRNYEYYKEALQVIEGIDSVTTEAQAFYLLDAVFNKENIIREFKLRRMAKRLLSIGDTYVWPIEAY